MPRRFIPLACLLAILVACSRAAPAELVYSQREFAKSVDRSTPAAMVFIYTPTVVPGASAAEALTLIRQTSGVSTVPQVMPAVVEQLVNEGYRSSAVPGRDDAFCAWRTDGRFVVVIATRGERTTQLHHWARTRDGNATDASCDGAVKVASLLDVTLASVP